MTNSFGSEQRPTTGQAAVRRYKLIIILGDIVFVIGVGGWVWGWLYFESLQTVLHLQDFAPELIRWLFPNWLAELGFSIMVAGFLVNAYGWFLQWRESVANGG